MATGYKAENAYIHSIFATTEADVNRNYVFSTYSYGYVGDLHNYVKSGNGSCWGLAPFSGYELRCAEYYKKNGVNVPFATRASSTVPIPNADGATSSWDPAPFKADFGIMRLDPEDYVNIKWDPTMSKCLISYMGYQYVDADGIWLFMQAPGGGGGGTDYASRWQTASYAGCGGGSGSSALTYLACRLLYREKGSAAYFRVKIGKPGVGGKYGTDGSSGTDGGSIDLQIVYGNGDVEEPLILGGGGGGGIGYHDAAGSKGVAGSVIKNDSSAYVWVIDYWDGASGSPGVWASGAATEEAVHGDNIASATSYLPMNADKYMLMRTQYDSSGNRYEFGRGSHPSWRFGGGGGGSACARVSYSTSYPDSVISSGIGGCGGQTYSAKNGTDGGEGCAYVLEAPVQTEAATRSLAAPELYYSKVSNIDPAYQVIALNDNNADVTCSYWLYDSTSQFSQVRTVTVPAKGSATLTYSNFVDNWSAGKIVKAQFKFDGEQSSITSLTLPLGGSSSGGVIYT